jgi:UDP-2,3-diacylglucosamine pyrophosphatase LpxH
MTLEVAMASVGLIQISDLHIGSRISGGGVIPRATAHDERVFEALQASLSTILQKRPRKDHALIVSGDVSAKGASDELRMYVTLRNLGFARDAYLTLPPLVKHFAGVIDIPGNHDYWNGIVGNGFVNRAARIFFGSRPWAVSLKTNVYIVTVHGLCSTIAASVLQQVGAVGAYDAKEMSDLDAAIMATSQAASSRRLASRQLIVTHHSPSYGNAVSYGISSAAMTSLQNFCTRNRISGLLTGHVHTRHIEPPKTLPVEARCGTTTQAAVFLKHNVCDFLYHEFRDSQPPGLLEWEITPWQFAGKRFVPISRETQTFTI